MQWQTDKSVFVEVAGVRLEGRCIGPSPSQADTIILLHEGLGSVELWRDFPEKLAAQSGLGVFVFARQGYGASDAVVLPRPLTYMSEEADRVLPALLEKIGFRSGYLLGHSDGASIAAIYAGAAQDTRLKAVILMAPHFFAEPESIAAIEQARIGFDQGDLRARLAKYHKDVDGAFNGWCDAWLDPAFMNWNIEAFIKIIDVPVMMVQGLDDQYGTLKQVDALKSNLSSRLQRALHVELLEACGHSPHLEQPERTLSSICRFIAINSEL